MRASAGAAGIPGRSVRGSRPTAGVNALTQPSASMVEEATPSSPAPGDLTIWLTEW